MHSLKLDEERKWFIIENKLSPFLKFFFKQIGGVKGSHIYNGLQKRNMMSMAYVLQKPVKNWKREKVINFFIYLIFV